MANPLVTKEEVKSYLFGDVAASSHDALLDELINYVSDRARWLTGRVLLDVELTEIHDGGGPFITLRDFPIISVTTVHEDLAQTFDAGTLVAASDYEADSRLSRLYRILSRWLPGTRNVQVVYHAGFVSTPDDMKLAAIQHVSLEFKAKDRLGIASKSFKDGARTYFGAGERTGEEKRIWAPYRNEVHG